MIPLYTTNDEAAEAARFYLPPRGVTGSGARARQRRLSVAGRPVGRGRGAWNPSRETLHARGLNYHHACCSRRDKTVAAVHIRLTDMNDPHVEALHYRIKHAVSVDFDKASPLEHEEPGFSVRIEKGQAKIVMKDHHPTRISELELTRP